MKDIASSLYPTIANITATYVSQVEAAATYITSSHANDIFLLRSDAAAYYQTIANAAATFLKQSDAVNTFATIANISATYINKNDAYGAFLTTYNASSLYMTQVNANANFLTFTNATVTFLKQSDASGIYATQSIIGGSVFGPNGIWKSVYDAIGNTTISSLAPSLTAIIGSGANSTALAMKSDTYKFNAGVNDRTARTGHFNSFDEVLASIEKPEYRSYSGFLQVIAECIYQADLINKISTGFVGCVLNTMNGNGDFST